MPLETAPGVYRLRVPLPFAMEALNAWLVDSGDGWVLIDSGMQTAAGWNALQREVAETGVDWRDIGTLLLTHMHPDHVGLAPKVQEASGAAIAMHVRDAELLRDFATPGTAEHWNGVALDLAGSPPELAGPVNAAFHLLTVKFPDLVPDLPLQGGERFGRLEAVLTPGHSPGHLCFLDRDRKILFSGDHILETTSPNIGWLPGENPLENYLASLAALAEREIELVLPGHGDPVHDHRAWIERTTIHHVDRLAQICTIVEERPATAHQITARIWARPLDPIHYRFAIFEVLAHLIYLKSQGRLESYGKTWRVIS